MAQTLIEFIREMKSVSFVTTNELKTAIRNTKQEDRERIVKEHFAEFIQVGVPVEIPSILVVLSQEVQNFQVLIRENLSLILGKTYATEIPDLVDQLLLWGMREEVIENFDQLLKECDPSELGNLVEVSKDIDELASKLEANTVSIIERAPSWRKDKNNQATIRNRK